MGSATTQSARPLSGLDSAFLSLETPTAPMHMTLVIVLEPRDEQPPDVERLRGELADRLLSAPVMRRRVHEEALGIGRPVLVDAGTIDVDAHIDRLGAPSPGSAHELADVVAHLCEIALPRDRPLWNVTIVDGLEGDRVALVARVHHALLDGAAGAALFARLFDTSPDAERERPARRRPAAPADAGDAPGETSLLLGGIRRLATTPVRLARFGLHAFGRSARMIRALGRARESAGEIRAGRPLAAPPVSFAGAVTGRRCVAFGRVDREDVKRIGEVFGIPIGDVLAAACTRALRAYLQARGELPDRPLIAAVPVALDRRDGRKDGNELSTLFAELPVALDDPLDVIDHVHRSTLQAKRAHTAAGGELLSGLADLLVPAVLSTLVQAYSSLDLADRHRPLVNLVLSNLRGPDTAFYCAGHRIGAPYPLGPIHEGWGLNVTVLSYAEAVHLGFLGCPDLLPDPWAIARAFESAVVELRRAADGHARH